LNEVQFNPLAALRTLIDHGVRFVLIGGFAANIRGSPVVTGDLDVCYARDRDNLERLAAALGELHAHLRGPDIPPDVPFKLDAKTLEMGDHFTFTTSVGSLDTLGVPAGTSGFHDLDSEASSVEIDDLMVRVASLDDLIRMKRAAGRPKDREQLEWLKAIQDMVDRGEIP